MQNYSFEYQTLLNGACVTVEMYVSFDTDWDGDTHVSFELVAVCFEGVDVSPVLDQKTLVALEMEAENAASDTSSDIPSHLPTL